MSLPDDVKRYTVRLELPADIDPATLRPGARVKAFLDQDATELEVLRVEPMLVCRAPDGSEVNVYAHEVYIVTERPGDLRDETTDEH